MAGSKTRRVPVIHVCGRWSAVYKTKTDGRPNPNERFIEFPHLILVDISTLNKVSKTIFLYTVLLNDMS